MIRVLANLSKRERTLFGLTVAVLFLSLLYNLTLQPLGRRWNQLNRRILDREIELKKNIRYLGQKEEVKRIYLQYADYVKKRGSDEEEMAAFLNAVEKEARVSGIRIADIKPKPVKALLFYKKYTLEMNCEASMEKYIEFIYHLQRSAQLIRTEKLKLVSQGQNTPLLKAQMFVTKVLTTH